MPTDPAEVSAHPAFTRRALVRHAITALLLVASVALGTHTVYSVINTPRVESPIQLIPVTDTAEASARRREIAGTYVTGTRPGDRTIIVHDDGRVEFSERTAKGVINAHTDTYQLARVGKEFALSTAQGGVIAAPSLETLIYYRDTYLRR